MTPKKIKVARGNAIIGQSGGPTVVINQSLVGAVLEARRHARIERVYGAVHGLRGVLDRNFIDLSHEPKAHLERVARTPSAALGSVRMKPNEDECAEVFETLKRLDVRYFFYIGGNDSAETARIIQRLARRARYGLHVFHIPKTIDNDLRGTDHAPGYPSAARFVAEAFMGQELDNRSLPGVNIIVVMGRNAGFLTAASALGRVRADSGPHLVYVPERIFDRERFATDVKRMLDRHGRCLIAVSEGIRETEEEPLAASLTRGMQADEFGNVQLSGSGALADFLTAHLRARIDPTLRVRADTLGYLQRSFAGVVSPRDAVEAREVGRVAVRMAAAGIESGSVSIVRLPGKPYRVKYAHSSLDRVARVVRHMPKSFINRAGNDITAAFEEYARPLVGRLPTVAFLKGEPVHLD